jgi:hypothetical protein
MSHNEEILTQIASKFLDIETLKVQNSDDKDFHDLAVWQIQEALEKAFAAGIERGWQMKAAQR